MWGTPATKRAPKGCGVGRRTSTISDSSTVTMLWRISVIGWRHCGHSRRSRVESCKHFRQNSWPQEESVLALFVIFCLHIKHLSLLSTTSSSTTSDDSSDDCVVSVSALRGIDGPVVWVLVVSTPTSTPVSDFWSNAEELLCFVSLLLSLSSMSLWLSSLMSDILVRNGLSGRLWDDSDFCDTNHKVLEVFHNFWIIVENWFQF